ncbi:MAG TPA: hypothetical protein VIY56_12580 [Vicinamibacterales bacterium]
MLIRLLVLVVAALAAAVPVRAQVELSGSWAGRNHEDAMERGPGPYAVDYTGLPLNDDGRDRALAYSGAQLGMIERQCGLYPPYYVALGPFGIKMWNESDPVSGNTVAWKIGAWEDRAATTIWMDGRPHPSPNAPHQRGGFTTGTWEGDTLVAYTTHMRAGVIRRNGVPSSDQASMTTYFFRNGDLMTMLVVVEDPVYLSEPFMLSKNFQLDAGPVRPIGPPCVPGYEGQSGEVPHYLPGANPSVDELTKLYGIPRAATLGGAPTMYPEFRKTIKDAYVRPEKCVRNCGGPPR